jgi:pyrimidine-nucleoside phosphorylase/thymidine phosphorylase
MGVIAADFDLPITIVQTSMVAPLGFAVGHALEVRESLECLRGGGPSDLRELVTLEGGELLRLVGMAGDLKEGRAKIGAALDDGSALGAFRAGVVAQGGDPELVDDPSQLPTAPDQTDLVAEAAGYLSFADCAAVGRAVGALGGGRMRLEDPIDHAVGVVFNKRLGDQVAKDEPICVIHHRAGAGLEEARAQLALALRLTPEPEVEPLVLDA